MWDFLFQPAGFDIGETGVLAYTPDQPLWWAMVVGLGNTLRVALPGLVLCTLLALMLALLYRYGTPVWRGMAHTVIELVRNVPLLLLGQEGAAESARNAPRGAVVEIEERKVMLTHALAQIGATPSAKKEFWADLKRYLEMLSV